MTEKNETRIESGVSFFFSSQKFRPIEKWKRFHLCDTYNRLNLLACVTKLNAIGELHIIYMSDVCWRHENDWN